MYQTPPDSPDGPSDTKGGGWGGRQQQRALGYIPSMKVKGEDERKMLGLDKVWNKELGSAPESLFSALLASAASDQGLFVFSFFVVALKCAGVRNLIVVLVTFEFPL